MKVWRPKKKELTKSVLYDDFVDQWFARQERKLKDSGAISKEESIKEEMWDYAISLANLMHQQQSVQVFYEPSEADVFDMDAKISDENPFSRFFDPSRPRVQFLQTSCFVRQTGINYFAFEHSSIFDFLVSKSISDASKNKVRNQRRTTIYQTKEESLNVALCSEAQINLLAERVKENDEFKQYLMDWLFASRNNAQYSNASANSITVLVKVGVTFNGADLSYLHLRGANISGGYFDRANFEGSDLENVKMHRVWMRQVNLQRCKLKGIDFGEYPWIVIEEDVKSIILRENINILVAYSQNKIFIYNFTTKKCIDVIDSQPDIACVDLSQDGKMMAICNKTSIIYVYDLKTQKIRRLEGPEGSEKFRTVHFVDDGKTLISSGVLVEFDVDNLRKIKSVASRVRKWDFLSETSKVLIESNKNVTNFHASCNGKIIAFSEGNLVKVYRLESEGLEILPRHKNRVEFICLSPDGNLLVSVESDRTILFFNLLTLIPISKAFQDSGDMVCVCLSTDNNNLISGYKNGEIRVRNLSDGESKSIYGRECPVTCVAISGDCQKVVSSSSNNVINFWNIESCQIEKRKKMNERYRAIGFIEKKLTIMIEFKNSYILREVKSGNNRLIHCPRSRFDHVFFSTCRQKILFERSLKKEVEVLDLLTNDSTTVTDVEIYCNSSDLRVVVFVSTIKKDTLTVLDISTKQSIEIELGGISLRKLWCNLGGDLIISEDDEDGVVRFWNVEKRISKVLCDDGMDLSHANFSQDSELVSIVDFFGQIQVFNIKSDKDIILLNNKYGDYKVFISRDKKTIVSVSIGTDTVRILDISSLTLMHRICVNSKIKDIFFSDDMVLMSIILSDDTAQVWKKMNENESSWQLMWSSDLNSLNNALNLADCDLRKAEGISCINQKLLSQREAILSTNPESESSKKTESTLVTVAKQNRSPIHMGQHRTDVEDMIQDKSLEKDDDQGPQREGKDKCVLC